MKTLQLTSALAVGAAIVALSAGGAFAAVTTDSALDVMASPAQNSKIIAHLDANANVSLVAMSKSWCKITNAGTTGWVTCAELNGVPAPRTNVVAKPSVNTDFQNDPYFGPTVPGGLHTIQNNESH